MAISRQEKWLLFAAVIGIFLFVSPLFILQEEAHIRVHDNLDSNLAWYKVLAESGQIMGSVTSTIPQIINGLPRDALGTEWSGIVWLHMLFSSMTAYAISQLITRLGAFAGMYLLLRTHVFRQTDSKFIVTAVSLAFALTPFWPSGMLSTLGHPLALWAFLSIRKRQASWKEWLVLTLLPLYASFVLGFFFLLAAVGVIWLYDALIRRKTNWIFLLSIAWMTFCFLAADYRLVYAMLFNQEPMHRLEFVSSRHDFPHTLRLTMKNFLLGHNHVMTVHTAVILPTICLALVVGFLPRASSKLRNLLISLTALNIGLSFWYALWFNKIWRIPKEKIELLTAFNFARFHFLRPLVIYVSFAVACLLIWKLTNQGWRFIVCIALSLQLALLCLFNEEVIYGKHFKSTSFAEFYAEEQFQAIKTYINQPQSSYRVASLGIHPAIAQYNGFYTLDTYNNIIPLSYKHEFRKIIDKELDKSAALKRYFDEWGSRLYIYSAELGKKYDYKKDSRRIIRQLELDTAQFAEMGGRYIFSAVPILNAAENQLVLDQVFEDDVSAWTIYLYRVQLTSKEDTNNEASSNPGSSHSLL